MSVRRPHDATPAALLSVDVGAAALAAASFTPLVSLVDTAIVRSANGSEKQLFRGLLASGLQALRSPGRFLADPKFLAVYAVYFATYAVANVVTTATHLARPGADPAAPRFLSATVTNISASMKKDALISRLTSPVAPLPAPAASLFAWGARDAMTVFASFVLVEPTAAALSRHAAPEYHRTLLNATQLALPVGIQWISTPIHVLGLDLYNHQSDAKPRHWRDRVALIRREYVGAAAARSLRIAAAFGVGGVANRSLHAKLTSVVFEDRRRTHRIAHVAK